MAQKSSPLGRGIKSLFAENNEENENGRVVLDRKSVV